MRFLFLAVPGILLASACGGPSEAPLPAPQPSNDLDGPIGGSLFASPSEQKLRREHALASELADTLKKISGIVDACVHLSLADRSLGSRNPTAPSKVAVLVVHDSGNRPDSAALRTLVAASIPGMTEEQVTVVLTPRAAQGRTTKFLGPLEIASSSITPARWLIASLIGACLFMALALIAAGLKIRRIRRTHNKH